MSYAYEREDGSIALCRSLKSIPDGAVYIYISGTDLPDKKLRNHWRIGPGVIVVDQAIVESEAAKEKIELLKTEALSRITAVLPGIVNFEALELVREQWLSIAPAARNPTVKMQRVIDIYQAARDGVAFLKSATLAEILAYNVINDPAWPA